MRENCLVYKFEFVGIFYNHVVVGGVLDAHLVYRILIEGVGDAARYGLISDQVCKHPIFPASLTYYYINEVSV